jgi:hypothetical protein
MDQLQTSGRPWRVKFVEESAIDAGGPGRELFFEIATSIFEPSSNLFIPSPNGRYHTGDFRGVFVPYSLIPQERLYWAIGVFLGIVVRCGLPQPLPFAPLVYKIMAEEKVGEPDVLIIDDKLKAQFDRLRAARGDADFKEKFGLKWECEDWDGTVCTLNKGAQVAVGADVATWTDAVIRMRLASVKRLTLAMLSGFHDNIGAASRPFVTEQLLSMLMQGSDIVTTEELRKITIFRGISSPEIIRFWEAVDRMTNRQRSLLLKIITALPRLPNARTKGLTICITRMENGDEGRLPGASTCFNRMYLPMYPTTEIAFQKLVTAIESCQTMENQ